jgi:hypothetical protein
VSTIKGQGPGVRPQLPVWRGSWSCQLWSFLPAAPADSRTLASSCAPPGCSPRAARNSPGCARVAPGNARSDLRDRPSGPRGRGPRAVRTPAITSPPCTRKSMSAGVDIGWWSSYGFSRSRDRAGPSRHELAGSSNRSCSAQDGAVVEFRSQELLQDGDGTDDRTGRPAVIRGRREQDRSTRKCSTQQ